MEEIQNKARVKSPVIRPRANAGENTVHQL